MGEIAISAKGLSKSFKRNPERRTSLKERLVRGKAPAPQTFWALKDASFDVPKGSSLGLIGHNGSGKSTALKVLTGIYRATSGTVEVNGSVSALLEVGAGFHPDLTGRDNIRLNATILGFSKREIDGLMDKIIEFADIGDFIDSPIKHYSSGMYLRLGFAVAVMVRPEILIVDEVIAVGDEEFQRKCFDHLNDLRKAGTTMVIVSHGLHNITSLCDEAIWLEGGRVRQMGPPREVTKSYLGLVNEREAQRVAAARGEATMAASHQVRGTGEIRVTGFELLDQHYQSLGVVTPGDAAVFQFTFEALQPVAEVVFGFAVENEQGLVLLAPNSQTSGLWDVLPGSGSFRFHVEGFPLSGGNYVVKPAIVSRGSSVFAMDTGYPMVVRQSDDAQAGLLQVAGEWDVRN